MFQERICIISPIHIQSHTHEVNEGTHLSKAMSHSSVQIGGMDQVLARLVNTFSNLSSRNNLLFLCLFVKYKIKYFRIIYYDNSIF